MLVLKQGQLTKELEESRVDAGAKREGSHDEIGWGSE